MNLFLLLTFGVFLFFSLGIYLNTSFVAGKNANLANQRLTLYPVLILMFSLFVIISSFQYIDLSSSARWLNSNSNDLSRYKMGFDSFGSKSLKEAFFISGYEPLYTLTVFLIRKITKHFSFALLIIYAFNFISMYSFLKAVNTKNLFFYFVFFVLFFTEILTSYCLLRMGIAVSFVLISYIFLMRKNYKKAILFSFIACGFHVSASFCFFVIVLYKFSENHTLKRLLFFAFVCFVLLLIFSKFLNYIITLIFPAKAVYLESNEGVAKNTYLTNFLFLMFLLFNQKNFYENKEARLMFCILLSTFYILSLQMVVTVFYRMIFFSYAGTSFIIYLLWNNYGSNKKMFSTFFVRSFISFYLLYFLYKFSTAQWFSYGLDRFKLFFVN